MAVCGSGRMEGSSSDHPVSMQEQDLGLRSGTAGEGLQPGMLSPYWSTWEFPGSEIHINPQSRWGLVSPGKQLPSRETPNRGSVSPGDFHLNAPWQNPLKKLLMTRGKLWKTC